MKPSSPWNCLLGSNKRLQFQALPWHYPVIFFFLFRNLFLLLFPPTSASPVTADKLRTLSVLPLPRSPAVLPALATPSSRPSRPLDRGLPSPRSHEAPSLPSQRSLLPCHPTLLSTLLADYHCRTDHPKTSQLKQAPFYLWLCGSEIWARLNLVVILLHIWWNEVLRWNSSSE